MSTCDDYRARVCLFLDDELRGDELQDFQNHLTGCSDCEGFLAEEQALSELLHRTRPLYQAPDVLRGQVSRIILSSEIHAGVRAPGRLRQRIMRILTAPVRNVSRPTFRWTALVEVGLVTILALLFVPQILQRVRADALVETAAASHRSYLEGNLPLEIHTSSPAAVIAWFAGKVPFQFRLPDSQGVPAGEPVCRLAGSRLVNFRGSYAALAIYEMQDQKISLLVVSDRSARAEGGEVIQSGSLSFHYHSNSGFNVITWSNHGLTYALVSSLPGSARQSCLVCHQNMADRLKYSRPE